MRFLFQLLLLLLSFSVLSQSAEEEHKLSPLDFGQGISFGISLLGSGIIGIPIRYSKNGINQLEFLATYSPFSESGNDIWDFEKSTPGSTLTLGFNAMSKPLNKSKKSKMIKNYISPKIGLAISTTKQFIGAITYRREAYRYHQKQYCRGFELGAIVYKRVGRYDLPTTLNYPIEQFRAYLSFDWNWFRAAKKA